MPSTSCRASCTQSETLKEFNTLKRSVLFKRGGFDYRKYVTKKSDYFSGTFLYRSYFCQKTTSCPFFVTYCGLSVAVKADIKIATAKCIVLLLNL